MPPRQARLRRRRSLVAKTVQEALEPILEGTEGYQSKDKPLATTIRRSPSRQGAARAYWWETSGSILIALLIELETKQLSLAFSRMRGMRGRSPGAASTTRGRTTISVIW